MVTNTSNASRNVPATNRRRFLVAAAAVPIAAVAKSRDSKETIDMNMHTSFGAALSNSVWNDLLSDYRTKRADWADNCDEDETLPERVAALEALGDKPIQPSCPFPDDISNMTLAQIKAYGCTPEYDAAWEDYEREMAHWNAARAEIEDRIAGPAKARDAARMETYNAALNVVMEHPVVALSQLREKLEIVVEEYRDFEFPESFVAQVISDLRRFEGVSGALTDL